MLIRGMLTCLDIKEAMSNEAEVNKAEDEAEDYDVDNPVLDDHDFDVKHGGEGNDDNEEKEQSSATFERPRSTKLEKRRWWRRRRRSIDRVWAESVSHFIDDMSGTVQRFFDLDESNEIQVVLPSDKRSLVDSTFKIRNLIDSTTRSAGSSRSLPRISLAILLSCIIAYFILPPMILSFCLFVFAFVVILALALPKLFRFGLARSLRAGRELLVQTKSVNYYLKEIELFSLANRRRLLLDASSTSTSRSPPSWTRLDDRDEEDEANEPFRELVFTRYRSYFWRLREWNQAMLSELDAGLLARCLDIDDKSSAFLCSIERNELSELLRYGDDDDAKLFDARQASGKFSIECIRSLAKFNRFLLSEHYRLALTRYFLSLILAVRPLAFIRLLFQLFKTARELDALRKDLSAQLNICKLVIDSKHAPANREIKPSNETHNDNKKEGKSTAEVNKRKQIEHLLAIRLRSALINCCSQVEAEEASSSFRLLKYDFEYCNLYFEKLLNLHEPNRKVAAEVESKESKLMLGKVAMSRSDDAATIIDGNGKPCGVEDDVLEADTFDRQDDDNDDEREMACEVVDDEQALNERENRLASKNLFYELKYALKFKQTEWSRREKRAIRLKKQQQQQQQDDNDDDDDDGEEHLLENESQKYKSHLLKRRLSRQELLAERNKSGRQEKGEENEDELIKRRKRKYFYEPSIALEESDEEKDKENGASSLLKEIMMKKQSLFLSDCDEEILD